jgi:hypothetical protein
MKCPVCGKQFTVLWPDLWRYKRGRNYLCGYGCMRMIDRGETVMEKFTKEQKAKAVEIALDGGDPKAYLESIGSKNPENLWYYIKVQLRKNDPETWEKLAGSPKRAPVETPESEFVPAGKPKPLDGGPVEKIEMPERKIESALTPENLKKAAEAAKEMLEEARKEKEKFFGLPSYIDGFEINGISGQFGIYRASSEHNYFEFVPFGGELCMNPGDWHEQIEELNRAAKVLGVKL